MGRSEVGAEDGGVVLTVNGTQRPLPIDLRGERGPFDLVGDVHGCRAELEQLLGSLGYVVERDGEGRAAGASHPAGRTVVLLGDLADRGPDTPGVFRLVMGMAAAGTALGVLGNHEVKLLHALTRKDAKARPGQARSLAQLAEQPATFREAVETFIRGLRPQHVLDGGRLVVCHAGVPERFHGEESKSARRFCLHGEETGDGVAPSPLNARWVGEYQGPAMVVYGHTPVVAPEWVNNTLCVDTGCVYGGWLTALRYPERALESVPAAHVYARPKLPFAANPRATSAVLPG